MINGWWNRKTVPSNDSRNEPWSQRKDFALKKKLPGKYAEKCVLTGPTSLWTECGKMGFGGEHGA
jgi:hypothetical protein